MSTPPQYDPEKANAWTRDLPLQPPIKERPRCIEAEVQAVKDRRKDRLEDIESAARAVIAAGRPHCHSGLGDGKPCACHVCLAWDALNQLLKEQST